MTSRQWAQLAIHTCMYVHTHSHAHAMHATWYIHDANTQVYIYVYKDSRLNKPYTHACTFTGLIPYTLHHYLRPLHASTYVVQTTPLPNIQDVSINTDTPSSPKPHPLTSRCVSSTSPWGRVQEDCPVAVL